MSQITKNYKHKRELTRYGWDWNFCPLWLV